MPLSEAYARIYSVVRKIPKGRVMTYGAVAKAAGLPRHARQVGYALHSLPQNTGVPWQRVVNAKGEVSPRPGHREQRLLLEMEGVAFDLNGRIDLSRYHYDPC